MRFRAVLFAFLLTGGVAQADLVSRALDQAAPGAGSAAAPAPPAVEDNLLSWSGPVRETSLPDLLQVAVRLSPALAIPNNTAQPVRVMNNAVDVEEVETSRLHDILGDGRWDRCIPLDTDGNTHQSRVLATGGWEQMSMIAASLPDTPLVAMGQCALGSVHTPGDRDLDAEEPVRLGIQVPWLITGC